MLGSAGFEHGDSFIKLRESKPRESSRFVELTSQLLALTLQFVPDHCMPFGYLPDVAAERFRNHAKMSLDLFHFFLTHGPLV